MGLNATVCMLCVLAIHVFRLCRCVASVVFGHKDFKMHALHLPGGLVLILIFFL